MCGVLAQECPGLARGILEEGLPKRFPDMSENLPSRFLSRPCPRGEDDQGKHTCTYPYTHSHPHIFVNSNVLGLFPLQGFRPLRVQVPSSKATGMEHRGMGSMGNSLQNLIIRFISPGSCQSRRALDVQPSQSCKRESSPPVSRIN